MKKVMFVLVSLLIVSTFAFALESGPSNKVGYVKIQCNGAPSSTVYTAFGLPFKFWYVPAGNVPTYGTENRKPSSIVGAQTFCGTLSTADRITRQDNGQFGYRNSASGCNWAGTLETNPANMEPGRAYWYANKSGANRNLVLAGEADTTGTGIPTVNIAAPAAPGGALPTPYSWRDPRDRNRANLNLITQGFTGGTLSTSDRVLAQVGGGSFYFRTSDNTWQGTTVTVTPGAAYWIQNKHFGHPFSYTYNASGAPIIQPNGGSELQKISASSNVPATATKARTTSKN